MSRMTLVTRGSEAVIEQITKQLNKLIDVVKLVDLVEGEHVEREILLLKVRVDETSRTGIIQLAQIFRGHIVDVAEESFVIEVTGTSDKIDAFINAIDDKIILETVRSGVTGIARGDKVLVC